MHGYKVALSGVATLVRHTSWKMQRSSGIKPNTAENKGARTQGGNYAGSWISTKLWCASKDMTRRVGAVALCALMHLPLHLPGVSELTTEATRRCRDPVAPWAEIEDY